MKKTLIFLALFLVLYSPALASDFRSLATGTGNISETIDPGRDFVLTAVRVHLSAAGGANDLVISVDSGAGAAYDVVLLTQDMTTASDVVFRPSPSASFTNGDKIVVSWTNASSRTYGLEVVWR